MYKRFFHEVCIAILTIYTINVNLLLDMLQKEIVSDV